LLKQPLVSVIIPNYNHAQFLGVRIESVLRQTYKNFEIIILDDCSTDDSKLIIEKFRYIEKIKDIIYNFSNSGNTFNQWKKGIQLAKGDYVWIAESDDFCEPELLEQLVKAHTENGNIGLAYCHSLPVNDQNIVYDRSDWWMTRVNQTRWQSDYINSGIDEIENYLSIQCTIPNASAVLFNIESFQHIDWNIMHYKVCGDWYVYVTILRYYNIAYIARSMNYHRNHHNNARTLYKKNIIIEQYEIISYIDSICEINKSSAYKNSLNERMEGLLALLRSNSIRLKDIAILFPKMLATDNFFIFRFFKIIIFKILRIHVNFR
jgi:glycosyltransferase involved in cell wall biosynthesis